MSSKILIVDDEESICRTLKFAFEDKYEIFFMLNPTGVVENIQRNGIDLVLLDMRIGTRDGIEVLREIKNYNSDIIVIVMTAYGTISNSVEAMKLGAFTYLSKPLDVEETLIFIEQALSYKKLSDDVVYLTDEMQEKNNLKHKMVGNSEDLQSVFKLIDKLRNVDSSVTILGESGTGKELAARAIHFTGKRSNNRFVVVNCASIPETLIEEEMFGHKKGTFTGAIADKKGKFALANNGTLFLDEIGDMPLALQSKILRALQDKEITQIGGDIPQKVDVRIIAATNKNIAAMVGRGEFREDLYYRLNVIEVRMPPLSSRKNDIPLLCEHFLHMFNTEQKKNIRGFTAEAMRVLERYNYPGNVRQLANIIERAVILSQGGIITTDLLPAEMLASQGDRPPGEADAIIAGIAGMPLKEVERLAVIGALRQTGGVKNDAAQSLGISLRTLWNKIKEYGIERM